MAEPPKPITRIAVPIDRSGRRRFNPVGAEALACAVVAGLLFLFALVAPSFGDPRVTFLAAVVTFVGSPVLIVGGIIIGIVALVKAANGHLGRAAALVAFVLLAAETALWFWMLLAFRAGLEAIDSGL